MDSQKPDEPATPNAPPRPRFATGRLVGGRYELLERIGEGGTAEVFKARDHRLDRVVAIKVLRPQFGQDATARARFATEARSAAALNVANIVPVYDFGAAEDGSLYIVMRFIDGPSLRQILADRGRLPAAAAADLGRQIAEALSAAHTHGLVHRDVKPGNILIDAQGTAHLTDFGTVKALAGADDLTRSGTTFGTAAYISPEQATGGSIGPATDLYALGAVLYEALSGQPLFAGDDAVALSYRHAHETPVRLASLLPGVDSDLEQLVMQSLTKVPRDRPSDAAAVARILERVARRIAPRHAPREALAEVVAGTAPFLPPLAADAHADQETVAIPVPVPAPGPGFRAVSAGALVSTAAAAAGAAPATATWAPVARGTAPRTPARASRVGARDEETRAGSAVGAALLVLALAVVVALGAFALSRYFGSSQLPGVAVATRTAPAPGRSAPVVMPPVATPSALVPTSRPTQAITPPVTPAPVPTPTPLPTGTATPTETPPPTPAATPTPAPTDPPTPPATAEATAPPAAISDRSVRVGDGRFVGDYPGDGTYHGRSASWVYGQGTSYNRMTAPFSLEYGDQVIGRSSLEIVGLDGENPKQNAIRIELNGVVLYEGPNPLPNDTCCDGSGPGNWGSVTLTIPRGILNPENALTVTNLEPTDCTSCPKFVMVDYFVVSYRART